LECVREKPQFVLVASFVACRTGSPFHLPPKRELKAPKGFARHCIYHLLMEAGIRFSGGESAARQDKWIL